MKHAGQRDGRRFRLHVGLRHGGHQRTNPINHGMSAAGGPSAGRPAKLLRRTFALLASVLVVAGVAVAAQVPSARPGASLSYDGLTFGWPTAAAGQPDNVMASGQTIDISGSGSELGLLDTAAYGPASGTGTVSYSDGTSQSFTLSVPNWYKAAAASANAVIVAPYLNRPDNTQDPNVVNVFEQSVPLQPGKQVVAVTLPDISAGAVSGSPSLHVFAMAIGEGS